MPLGVHIKENPTAFHRFESVWTPTALVLDENGKERHRIEGYLPKDEFAAQLLLGLARVAFMQKKWADSEKLYDEILQKYPNSVLRPSVMFWQAENSYRQGVELAKKPEGATPAGQEQIKKLQTQEHTQQKDFDDFLAAFSAE